MIGDQEKTIRDIIYLGSTSLTETQKRYSPVELESLALAWAVGKSHYYLYEALQIFHYTDSTGVVGLRKKDLSEVKNPRIQRILEKVIPYNISSIHIPASRNGISDYFSRYPSTKKCMAEEPWEQPTEWSSRGFFMKKGTKDWEPTKVRLVTDFRDLNKVLKRPGYQNEVSSQLVK